MTGSKQLRNFEDSESVVKRGSGKDHKLKLICSLWSSTDRKPTGSQDSLLVWKSSGHAAAIAIHLESSLIWKSGKLFFFVLFCCCCYVYLLGIADVSIHTVLYSYQCNAPLPQVRVSPPTGEVLAIQTTTYPNISPSSETRGICMIVHT